MHGECNVRRTSPPCGFGMSKLVRMLEHLGHHEDTQTMENQMEKDMENEKETRVI